MQKYQHPSEIRNYFFNFTFRVLGKQSASNAPLHRIHNLTTNINISARYPHLYHSTSKMQKYQHPSEFRNYFFNFTLRVLGKQSASTAPLHRMHNLMTN